MEVPVNDSDLAAMTYRDAVRWAAQDGYFLLDRLERIARARAYKTGWVYYNRDRPLEEVLKEHEEYVRTHRELTR